MNFSMPWKGHAITYHQCHFKVKDGPLLMPSASSLLTTHVSKAFPEGDFPVPKEQHCDMGESSIESIRSHGFCSTTAAGNTLPLFPGWCVQAAAPFALQAMLKL